MFSMSRELRRPSPKNRVGSLHVLGSFIAFVTTYAFLVTSLCAVTLFIYGNYDFAGKNPEVSGTELYFGELLFIFFMAWIFTFVLAIIPFAIGIFFIIRAAAVAIKTFVLSGALTGFLLSPVFALLPGATHIFDQQLLGVFVFLSIIFGAIAGFSVRFVLQIRRGERQEGWSK